MLTEGDSSNVYMNLREEFGLHRFLSRLENLSSAAASEVDLRGPFPKDAYSDILKSTGAMLDAFHAMNVMIMKNPRATKGEAEILRYTMSERAQLSARISHLFQGTQMVGIEIVGCALLNSPSTSVVYEARISSERGFAKYRTHPGSIAR